MPKYILAIDAGTTSSRAILFDHEGQMCAVSQKEFTQIYPRPGWVEHNALEIWDTQMEVIRDVVEKASASFADIAAIGITNQRETTVVWDRKTGEPVFNATVWQCRRTAEYCDGLKQKGLAESIQQKTGLLIDPYFSGTKIHWILENVPEARERAEKGDLLFGTIDSWLIWKLTGGSSHVTDYSNASRTMCFNIHSLEWDKEILSILEIPEQMLPEVKASGSHLGTTDPELTEVPIPITGAAGDQQAALFGQACFEPGQAKNTYGTGCFLLMNTGEKPIFSKNGLVTTIAWGFNGKVNYALEGSIFTAGAAVQWLRDELMLIKSASETEAAARSVPDSNGVYLVPAFTGLGAPYWDPYARGAIVGITRGANRNHIIRAVLESIAYQTADVLAVMQEDSGIHLSSLKVDGGAAANNFLMQFQSDVINAPVLRPSCLETTAMGAAFFAGLTVGFWSSQEEIVEKLRISSEFTPQQDEEWRQNARDNWHKAVSRSLGWTKA